MQLDSVRELKAGLLQSVVPSLPVKKSGAIKASAKGKGAQPSRIQQTVALGVSSKGGSGYRLAVRVQRRDLLDGPEVESIRKRAKGEVDVQYVGRLSKQAVRWNQQRVRPLRPGLSIGHYKITAGTLGCFVTSRKTGELFMLSNNHVLANENDADEGDAIVQAGPDDGGKRSTDRVGRLATFVKLKKTVPNIADCALASIDPSIESVVGSLKGIGALGGLGPEFLPKHSGVAKVGRTTGVRHGRVTAFELDNVVVEYDFGNASFNDQIEIEGAGLKAFSDGGDSGSLIVDDDRLAVGLLFAGGEEGGANGAGLTYAHPIRTVLDLLKVDLAF